MADLPDAVFRLERGRYVPTPLAAGPWSRDAQHGGAPSALLAGLVERHDPGPASFVARVTVELLRPVPLTPLDAVVRTIRPGRKVQWIEAALLADGREVARAMGLRVRRHDVAFDDGVVPGPVDLLPPPADGEPFEIEFADDDVGFWRAMELRQVRGRFRQPGPGAVWFRLRVPVVEGQEPSALQRVMAAADFSNGVGSPFPFGRYVNINADLTVALHRHPAGEWVALDAAEHPDPSGVALAESVLHDEHGRLGRAVQTLLVERTDLR